MLGGFTFKGVHSSVYGVRETPGNRVLSPQKRRTLITIPGRSDPFIEEDGGYEPREESITCSYTPQRGYSLKEQARRIAAWLDGVGELTFDYDPMVHYRAYLNSAPPAVFMLEQFAQFSLTFTIVHPFAYETARQQKVIAGAESATTYSKTVRIDVGGTINTPVRFIIKNLTDKRIKRLKITHKYVEDL